MVRKRPFQKFEGEYLEEANRRVRVDDDEVELGFVGRMAVVEVG